MNKLNNKNKKQVLKKIPKMDSVCQEAVRWTEMIRASKTTDTPIDKKNKQGIWKLWVFSFECQKLVNTFVDPYLEEM